MRPKPSPGPGEVLIRIAASAVSRVESLHVQGRQRLSPFAAARPRPRRRGVDVVIENVGEATWDTSLKSAVGGGRIVVCGATTGPNPTADLQRVFIRQLQIIGVAIGNFDEFRTLIDTAERELLVPHIDRV